MNPANRNSKTITLSTSMVLLAYTALHKLLPPTADRWLSDFLEHAKTQAKTYPFLKFTIEAVKDQGE